MFRDGDCLTGAAAMKAKDNTMKNREPAHIPSDVPSRDGNKKSTKQKRGHNTASYFKMAEPGTCSTEQESRSRVMINNNERKIKRADRTTTRDGQRNQFLSAKGLDLVERFYLQYDKLRRLGEQGPVPGTIWNSRRRGRRIFLVRCFWFSKQLMRLRAGIPGRRGFRLH